MKRGAGALLLALCLGGCASLRNTSGDASPAAARMRLDPQHLILLTVANPAEPVALYAGSTPRGYEAMPLYGAGDGARATLEALEQSYGLREVAGWPIAPLQVHCVVLEIPAGSSREELLARLGRDARVGLAQPLQTFGTLSAGYNDPYFGLQRGFAQIDAGEAQQWSRGEGVRVAVIDTGLDSAHPDLQGRIEARRNFVDDDARQFDADRHGTEVAGIIAADVNNREGIVGVAPGVRIFALKACWQLQPLADSAQCNSFTLAQALTIAIESGAQVINLSLGGPADPLLAQLVEYAGRRGIVVIGAVPPDGRSDGFPVGVTGVIAVDAVERPASAAALRAPGREVLTLTPGGHYDFVSGSSLAAAHVSGAAALLLAIDPHLDAGTLRNLLRRSSAGGAAINICAAIAALRPAGTCAARADGIGAAAVSR